MGTPNTRPRIERSGPIRFEDLGLTDEELTESAVEEAESAVNGLEELGIDPGLGLRRRANADPELVAKFVALYSTNPNGGSG